jgi:hypothetical protein
MRKPRLLHSIYADGKRPVLEVNPAFEWITDEGRSKMNAYLLQMFGFTAATEIQGPPPPCALEVGEGIVRLQGKGTEADKLYAQELANKLYLPVGDDESPVND